MESCTVLDLGEPQILVYFGNDDIPFHHRVLAQRLGEGQWLWATPDFDYEVVNLGDFTFRPIGRGEEVPLDQRPCYLFDNPIAPARLHGMRTEAQRFVAILGGPTATGAPGPAGRGVTVLRPRPRGGQRRGGPLPVGRRQSLCGSGLCSVDRRGPGQRGLDCGGARGDVRPGELAPREIRRSWPRSSCRPLPRGPDEDLVVARGLPNLTKKPNLSK